MVHRPRQENYVLRIGDFVNPDSPDRLILSAENGALVGNRAPGGAPEESLIAQLRDAVSRLADTFQASAALVERRGRMRRLLAHAVRSASLPDAEELWTAAAGFTRRQDAIVPVIATVRSERWTIVRVPARPPGTIVLVLHGDWTQSSAPLVNAADALAAVLDACAVDERARRDVAIHRMARLLARAEGLPRICAIVAATIARALDARIGTVAVLDRGDQTIRIQGTYGYPKLLVEDARIKPGQGILGGVFNSGVPLCVADVRSHPGLHASRPRYRTNSFVAVPIRARNEALGVLCVTDRFDNEPFTRSDVTTLRAFAAPVALALGREQAAHEAEYYARAAAIDPVSGLFNRRYFHVRLEEELERARRHQIPVALLMLDIDDFKRVNDTFGHLAGDTVIHETAEIVRRSVRLFDVCTRYGGEEFAIVMPGSSAQAAANVAERIRQRIEVYRSSDPVLASLSITVSIGVAVSVTEMSPRDFLDRADHALYEAKRSGKNCVWPVERF